MYIFEQKDINSSKISDNGELIKQFYVDQKTFQEYLKDQLKKEEISLESDLLLKEFFHEMDNR
jgi:DNA-directed RNA polymerase specialized sigma54-like protein